MPEPYKDAMPLTMIVPFRSSGASQSLVRLRLLLAVASRAMPIIVVDDTLSAAEIRKVRGVVSEFGRRATHLHHPETVPQPFSIGKLRDVGASAARDGFLFFHDVDYFAPPSVYRDIARLASDAGLAELEAGGFVCVPVAFLTRGGTPLTRSLGPRIWPLLADRRLVRLRLVDRLVLASSAMIVHRRTLLAHGGHNPLFSGHGAEDFELMHRLSADFPRGARPPDYHVDFGARRASQGGFRSYFARYAAPIQARGIHLAHAWHPRRVEDPRYYAQRSSNFAHLLKILADPCDQR